MSRTNRSKLGKDPLHPYQVPCRNIHSQAQEWLKIGMLTTGRFSPRKIISEQEKQNLDGLLLRRHPLVAMMKACAYRTLLIIGWQITYETLPSSDVFDRIHKYSEETQH